MTYKLKLFPMRAEAYERFLRNPGRFGGFDEATQTYTINDPGSAGMIPVALVTLTEDGLLFEDLLSKSVEAAHVLHGLIDMALMNDARVECRMPEPSNCSWSGRRKCSGISNPHRSAPLNKTLGRVVNYKSHDDNL
jgi:hypothetical protein